MMLVDSHIHLYEYSDEVIDKLCRNSNYLYLAVSDDYESSLRTLSLASRCSNVIPAIGIHPWEINEVSTDELEKVLALTSEVKILGEIGLDKKFVPHTFNKQLEIFKKFIDIAKDLNLGLSIHAAGAWREVIDLISRNDIRYAIIHWYTGPTDLLKDIESLGYFIGVNAAIKIQRKMRSIVEKAPLEIMLTESDGPYEYRGLRLDPSLIPEALSIIAEIKEVDVDYVREVIFKNMTKFLVGVGIRIEAGDE